jgi:hypothetical protein
LRIYVHRISWFQIADRSSVVEFGTLVLRFLENEFREEFASTLTLWDVESKKGNASHDDIEKGMSRAAQQLEAFSRAGG